MCMDCWQRRGSPSTITPAVRAVLPLIDAVYEHHAAGGGLHIVLDDWNVDDQALLSFTLKPLALPLSPASFLVLIPDVRRRRIPPLALRSPRTPTFRMPDRGSPPPAPPPTPPPIPEPPDPPDGIVAPEAPPTAPPPTPAPEPPEGTIDR